MTNPNADGFLRSDLIHLVGRVQRELRAFHGFELSAMAVLLRVDAADENIGETDLAELSRLARICRDNLDRLLRVMCAEGLISLRRLTSNTAEIQLSPHGYDVLCRILFTEP